MIERDPVENLLLAVLLNLLLDYRALWCLDMDRIRDMRYYRNGRPLRYKRGRPSKRAVTVRKRQFNKWLAENRDSVTKDMLTWGAELADDLDLTSRDKWIRLTYAIRDDPNGKHTKVFRSLGRGIKSGTRRKTGRMG